MNEEIKFIVHSSERYIKDLNEYPRFDTQQSDGEVSVMMELWGKRSTSVLTSLPSPLKTRVVAADRVLSICSNRTKLF